jgi:hypothetical protein
MCSSGDLHRRDDEIGDDQSAGEDAEQERLTSCCNVATPTPHDVHRAAATGGRSAGNDGVHLALCIDESPGLDACACPETTRRARMHRATMRVVARKELESVVARVDPTDASGNVTLCRNLSPHQSAVMIHGLAGMLATVSPEARDVLQRVAASVASLALQGITIPGDYDGQRSCSERQVEQHATHSGGVQHDLLVMRARAGHGRALEALRFVSTDKTERIALVVECLRQAAKLLVPANVLVRVRDGNCTHRAVDQEHVARSERAAVAMAFWLIPDLKGQLDDAVLLAVLVEMARPPAPNKNSNAGKAAWKRIIEENERRLLAKLAPVRAISLADQARACLPVLAALHLQPEGDDPVAALRQSIDRGWTVREDALGVRLRDRAARASDIRKPAGSMTPHDVDKVRRAGDGASHGTSKSLADTQKATQRPQAADPAARVENRVSRRRPKPSNGSAGSR